MLQVDHLAVCFRCKVLDALQEVLRQSNVGEDPQVGRVQKRETGLPLCPPHVAVGIDDTISKQIPRSPLDEVALGEDALIFEDEFQVPGVMDENPGG